MKKIKRLLSMFIVLLKFFFFSFVSFFSKNKETDLWLISERGDDARDNSYWLFKYIREEYPNINIKYIIDKKSSDYCKVKECGDVIQYGSAKHYKSLICAKYLISTHICGYTPDISLFTRLEKLGLFRTKGKKIYLQHGINKNDLGDVDGADLIISGSVFEYNHVINTTDRPERIAFTGLSRFDVLPRFHKKTNRILFMPTFRRWTNYYSDDRFKKTDYYIGIQSLLDSRELSRFLDENNLELVFYPHYETQKRLNLFSTNSERVTIASFDKYDVQQLLIESDLLITDFSSVFFDFGYMNKPTIYYQTDANEYYEKHYSRGFFSFEKNGFGEIVSNTKELIKLLQFYVKNDYQITNKYKARIDSFFGVLDHKNRERIVREILELDKK